MRKPAPLRLDDTYNGDEGRRKGMEGPQGRDNEQQPDEDDGGRGERQESARDENTHPRLQRQAQARLIVVATPITIIHCPITLL